MFQRVPTDWNKYKIRPRFLDRLLFLDHLAGAYLRLLEKVEFQGPLSILELGAGTGYSNLKIAKHFPVHKVTIVDLNARMLTIARETLLRSPFEVSFLREDVFKLDLREKFDLVHSAGLVEHFEDEKRRELIKIHAQYVKKGGYCVIFAPTPTLAYWFWRKVMESVHLWPFTDELPLSQAQLIKEVEETGLRVLGSNYFYPLCLTEVGVLAKKGV